MNAGEHVLGRAVRVPALGISLRVSSRAAVVGTVLAATTLVLLIASVGYGEAAIAPVDVVAALLGGGDAGDRFVVETLRLPRALTAILVGAGLGASGAIFQTVTRNPLGSPDVIGFVQGAAAGAVLQIVLFDGSTAAVAAAAVAGGLVTAAAVYLLALRGGAPGYRLILVGIGVNALLLAVTQYLVSRADLDDAIAAQSWITGTLAGRGWDEVEPLAAALVLLLPLAVMAVRSLRMLELGDEAAVALGLGAERARLAVMAVAVCLCAAATAAAGPVAFVALAAPQIARRLTRASGANVLCAALTGAVLVTGADLVSRLLFPERELPVGVVTGVAGGLYLLALLLAEWRRAAR